MTLEEYTKLRIGAYVIVPDQEHIGEGLYARVTGLFPLESSADVSVKDAEWLQRVHYDDMSYVPSSLWVGLALEGK